MAVGPSGGAGVLWVIVTDRMKVLNIGSWEWWRWDFISGCFYLFTAQWYQDYASCGR